MLIYEREEHKGEGGRVGRLEMGEREWGRGKPIESCLNKVWELKR